MAGLARVTQALFATTGLTPTAGFGGPAAGTLTTEAGNSNTPANIMTGTGGAWAAGWLNATLGSSKFPTIEDMNAVLYTLSYQLGYLLERGIAEYDIGTNYNIGDICRSIGGTHMYSSLTNANLNNALPAWPYANANWQPFTGGGRIALTANTTFYLSTAGNDGTGTGAVGSPWLSRQHASNYIQSNIDLAGFTATVQMADGSYSDSGLVVSAPYTGGGVVQFQGNLSNIDNVVINSSNNCFQAINGASIVLNGGYKLVAAAGGLLAQNFGLISTNGPIDFGACPSGHITAGGQGNISMGANYTISGSAVNHYRCEETSYLNTRGLTITLTGTPAFSGGFASVYAGSSTLQDGMSFSGSATGARYAVNSNGILQTSGGGANYFPGNAAGSTGTGGIYS